MKISIAFNNNYKNINIVKEVLSAYVRDGFLKVLDLDKNLHCYNIDVITAYHIEFDTNGCQELLHNISKAAKEK